MLPIDQIMPEILHVLTGTNRLVLAAPPGAGKTTRVPLALAGLDAGPGITSGRILLLEPRRVAARMAAERMASALGQRVGALIGLSTRVDRKVSAETRIEVMTDGLLTRRLLADQSLPGVGAIIFDEFHERRLNTDLGLALAMEVQSVLREDLRLLVMSATLDTERIRKALDAPVLESEGRVFPVRTVYLGRSDERLEERMSRLIRQLIREQEGSILAFLPGAREIRRTAEALEQLGPDIIIAPLYGALSPAEQDKAVSPAPEGRRKVVLATDIAESSLTIAGVRIVIDAGLARVAEESAGGAGARLITIKASRASVDQRRGRAGRTGPGICYRLWDEEATRGLAVSPTPEILSGDLSGLALTLAEWGTRDAAAMTWIDPPPVGRLTAARQSLKALGALDHEGHLTMAGAAMARIPLPPRLSALIVRASSPQDRALAAEIAALMSEPGMGGDSRDLRIRLDRFRADTSPRARALRQQARVWGGSLPVGDPGNAGRILAMAWPDRIARRRSDGQGNYLLSSGGAVTLHASDPLAGAQWLVVAEAGGAAREPAILLAQPISEAEALMAIPETIEERASFDSRTGKFSVRRIRRIGAIMLSETALPRPSPRVAASVLLEAVQREGLEVIGAAEIADETLARLGVLSASGLSDHPALSSGDLISTAGEWLLPLLERKGASIPAADEVRSALVGSFDWQVQEMLRREAPLHIELPSGQSVRINWLDPRAPLVSARAQSFYGVDVHPCLAAGRVPVTVELLSPGMKPAATTRDLPAFWRGGYRDMARDMRARYPKHDWPDDPSAARAHEGRTKKRLQETGKA